jgi:hypothetical protein
MGVPLDRFDVQAIDLLSAILWSQVFRGRFCSRR